MLMTIFDKSFIHAISADEAAVFDMHFMSNITPLFFVEVLADLEKAGTDRPEMNEAIVKGLAGKTPVWRSYPNIPHNQIVGAELSGEHVELCGRPLVGGGRRVRTDEGLGTVFDEPPEMKAKARWHQGEFGPEEYITARAWRDALAAAPLSTHFLLGGAANRFSFDNLEAVKRHVDKALDRDGSRYSNLKAALSFLNVPPQEQAKIITRWKAAGGPKISDFLPYTAHILKVDLFRILAMASDLMSASKTSNYADMAYLYYLPFCHAFISTDKLHRKAVPLFLRKDQVFVWGPDLRPQLAALVRDYLADPDLDELGLVGLTGKMRFPAGTFIGDLFRSVHPLYRDDDEDDFRSKMSPEAEKALVARLMAVRDAPPPFPDHNLGDEDQTTTFVRHMPRRRGRFNIMPRSAEAGD